MMKHEPTTSIEDRDLIRRLLLRRNSDVDSQSNRSQNNHSRSNDWENAWNEFVLKYQRLVLSQVSRTASRLQSSVSQAEIEDLCANVFSNLLQKDMQSLRSFDGRSKLGTWLTVVTRRITIRELSRKHRLIAKESIQETIAESGHDALSEMIKNEDKDRLKSSLDSLEDADREILELFYEQNMGYKEISVKLGISVNTVGPKLSRAHNRLRKRMRWI